MKHGLVIKFLVILLTGCSLVAAVAGVAGIVAMESANLYVNGLDELQIPLYNDKAEEIANQYVDFYAVRNLGNLTYPVWNNLYSNPSSRTDAPYWTIKLMQGDQVLVEPAALDGYTFSREYNIVSVYPMMELPSENDSPEQSEKPEDSSDPDQDGFTLPPNYFERKEVTIYSDILLVSNTYELYYYEGPEYTITVYMQPEVLESSSLHLLTAMYPYRDSFIPMLAISIVLAAAGLVFLCHQAGRANDGSIHPAAFNRMPVDLYAIATIIGVLLLWRLHTQLSSRITDEGPHLGNLSLLGLNLFAMFILGVGLICAIAAQVKMSNYYLWKHSFIGFVVTWIFRGITLLGKGLWRLLSLAPLLWRWLTVTFIMAVGLVILFFLAPSGAPLVRWLLMADLFLCLLAIGYLGYAFGVLLAGVQKMARGELSHQVETRYLIGEFRHFGDWLNALSGTAMETAQKHLRSERTKADLITNVSHDIKTPLTSIINYVDLLKQARSETEKAQYLDILSNQSQRLKRLIDDLIELSKASSGSLQVELSPMDAAEAINQALGEFSEQLEAVALTPIFSAPEESITMIADGKLFWRVISNLFSNAVKYAMPGTRLYIDLAQHENKVLISLKNVSKEKLYASSEYLLERFAQGDASRNTEGSGLGLNIAKTLMEVQQGRLQLVADGDLFKVTLVFPACS